MERQGEKWWNYTIHQLWLCFLSYFYVEYSLPNKNKLESGNFVINIARLNLLMMTSYENVVVIFIPYSKIVYDYTFAAGACEDKVYSLKPTLFPWLVWTCV
jgi:hypothetical protein